MTDFMITNIHPLVGITAVIEFVILVLFVTRFFKGGRIITLCMTLVSLGLFIDSLLLTVGGYFGEGMPEALSRLRFIAHGAFVPMLFPLCGYALKLSKRVMTALWVFTVIVLTSGVAGALSLDLELVNLEGFSRHASSDLSPIWAEKISRFLSYGTVIPLIISGIIVWVREKRPQLFLAGFFMFAFAALGPATGNFNLIFFISMIGEILMILFFYLYDLKEEKHASEIVDYSEEKLSA